MDAGIIIAGLAGGYALGSMIEAEERAARIAGEMGTRVARHRMGQNGAQGGGPAPGAGPGAPAGNGNGNDVNFSPLAFGRFGMPWWGSAWPYQYPQYPALCPPAYGWPGYGWPGMYPRVPAY